jgi:hypothetical protein
MMRTLQQVTPILLLMIAAAYLGGMCLVMCSCSPRITPEHAEAAYTAELLRCVDTSATLEASKACRAQADQRWKLDGGTHGDR